MHGWSQHRFDIGIFLTLGFGAVKLLFCFCLPTLAERPFGDPLGKASVGGRATLRGSARLIPNVIPHRACASSSFSERRALVLVV